MEKEKKSTATESAVATKAKKTSKASEVKKDKITAKRARSKTSEAGEEASPA